METGYTNRPRSWHRDYGGNLRFNGQAATVKCFENNPLVRKVCHLSHGPPDLAVPANARELIPSPPCFMQSLEEDGRGRVLVVDGGGSMRCALLGDNIAEMAYKNGWSVSSLTGFPRCCPSTGVSV